MASVEVLAVGTELLLGQISNTNGQYLARVLARHGALHYRQTVVGDNQERVEACLREALGRTDMVVTIGGLGPTEDDLTKAAVAAVFDRRLVLDPGWWDAIIARRGGSVPTSPSARRMAEIPEGAEAIPNHHGTAAGVLLRSRFAGKDCVVVCLPGPPSECLPMIDDWLAPFLATWVAESGGPRALVSRSLRIAGLWESTAEGIARAFITGRDNPSVAPYAGQGEVELRLTARADTRTEAEALLAPVETALRAKLGPWLYGVDEETLPGVVLEALVRAGKTLAVAESCTGGLLAQRLTEIPGSSRAFVAGVVGYANRSKERLLGVSESLWATHGAVSEAVAIAMASGAAAVVDADIGVGITGVAGPDGGTAETPVGTVFLALHAEQGNWCWRLRLRGSRSVVRFLATQHALLALHRFLGGGVAAMEELGTRGFYL